MFALLRLIIILGILGGAGYGLYYVSNLQANLAIAKNNAEQMERAVEQQQATIEQQKRDYAQILESNQRINNMLVENQNRLNALTDRFDRKANGEARDFAALALARPAAIERVINNASKKALRCLEIATGSPVTPEELAVTKRSEANNECPYIHPLLGESLNDGVQPSS